MRHLTRWAANLHVRTKFLLILLMAISLVSATALLSFIFRRRHTTSSCIKAAPR